MWQSDTENAEIAGRRKGGLRDLTWGVVLAAFWILHVIVCFAQGTPVWACCFPIDSLAPYMWSCFAVSSAAFLLWRAFTGNRRMKTAQATLAFLLLVFTADTLTGGDYRWFELSMRQQLQKCGGAIALQEWAQSNLENIGSAENLKDQTIDPHQLPPSIQGFAAHFNEISYVFGSDYSVKAILFEYGGWAGGSGILIGKRDIAEGGSIRESIHATLGWTKQLRTGVWLFSFRS